MFRYFYIEGYGCPSNTYDLKILEHTVMGLGLRKVENPVNADVIIVNTCAVKKPTEDHIISRLRVLNRLGKPLIISGCLPVVNLKAIEHAAPEYLAVLGPNSLERIGEAIEGFPAACKLNLLSSEPSVKVGFVPPQRGEVIGILPIAEGCLGECSFCCTRFARGRLFSYPVDAIVEAVKKYVEVGAREIWLVAQDTSAYGLDIGSDLPTLLSEVCKIEGDFIVRVGMMSPKGCLPMLNRLIEAFHNPKVFKFLHLPLQSGNDDVLMDMRRGYTVDDFLRIVQCFREEIPNMTLWTDIICGYPTEDEEAFIDSLKVIDEVEPDTVNISKFSPRPMTQASRLKLLPSYVVKDRSRRMAKLCARISLERNLLWVNWVGRVLIDETGKNSTWVGRNETYKPIVVRDGVSLGEWVKVHVVNAEAKFLLGRKI